MLLRSVYCCLFCLFLDISWGQHGKQKLPSYFGFQVKPIFPGVFIGVTEFNNNKGDFHTVFSQSQGYSFGGIVRLGITPLIAIETSINLTQRRYLFRSSLPTSDVYVSSKLRYLTYNIPVSALFYLRMSERVYMNASLGAGISYNPTAVGVRISKPNTHHQVSQLGIGRKVVAETIANLGWEYRSEKYGTFYLGAIACIPFSPLFYLRSEYQNEGLKIQTDLKTQGRVDGSYIAVELKYFLPIVKSKGSPIKTPIE